jgi:hypothetical protein
LTCGTGDRLEGDEHREVVQFCPKGVPMKRLLVVSLLAAAVLAPTAAARTITVATSSGVTPSSDPIQIYNKVSPLPRSITIVTSGPIIDVRASISCYDSKSNYSSTARDNRAGRLALGYDHTMRACLVEAYATAKSAIAGRPFKIALQIER